MVPVLVFGSSLGVWELSVRHLSVQITFPDPASLGYEKPWSEACLFPSVGVLWNDQK